MDAAAETPVPAINLQNFCGSHPTCHKAGLPPVQPAGNCHFNGRGIEIEFLTCMVHLFTCYSQYPCVLCTAGNDGSGGPKSMGRLRLSSCSISKDLVYHAGCWKLIWFILIFSETSGQQARAATDDIMVDHSHTVMIPATAKEDAGDFIGKRLQLAECHSTRLLHY